MLAMDTLNATVKLGPSLTLFEVARISIFTTRSVSEGMTYVDSAGSAIGPSLTRRVVKNNANRE